MSEMKSSSMLLRLALSLAGAAASTLVAYLALKYVVTDIFDPTSGERKSSKKRAKEILKAIGIANVELSEYELCLAANLIEAEGIDTDWEDIGGLQDVIAEIKENVILPFTFKGYEFKSALLEAPKGMLLFGPPGCGKTMIAKALAKTTNARFLHLQVSSILDKWYGETEKRIDAVFSLAEKLQPTVLFLDEVDALFSTRTSYEHETSRILKTQFMSLWDGLLTRKHCRVLVIGATNRAEELDRAILRRMPCRFLIPSPGRDWNDLLRLFCLLPVPHRVISSCPHAFGGPPRPPQANRELVGSPTHSNSAQDCINAWRSSKRCYFARTSATVWTFTNWACSVSASLVVI